MNPKSLYKTNFVFLVIVLTAAALRLYALGRKSFWFDEAITLDWTKNIAGLFKINECTPPLYPFLISAWKLLGVNEFALRSLSVALGVYSVFLIYLAGKMFFDRKTALIASFILAVSPFHIFYSQESTGYVLLAFLVLVAICFFKKALEISRWYFWLGFAFFAILSVFTHYTAFLLFLSEVIFFLASWKRYKHLAAGWIAAHIFMIAVLLPHAWFIISQLVFGVKIHLGWWIPPLSLEALAITFKNFSVGYNALPKNFVIASIIYFSLFLIGIFSFDKKKDHMLLLLLAVIPALAAFILLKFDVKIYVDRYFLPSAMFYYIIVARGLSRFRNKYALLSFLLLLALSSGFSLKSYYLNYLPNSYKHHIGVQRKPDFRDAACYIADNFQKGDIVGHINENSMLPMEYYLDVLDIEKRLWVRLTNDLSGIEAVKYNLGDQIPGNKNLVQNEDVLLRHSRRIWLVVMLFEGPEDIRLRIMEQFGRHYTRIGAKEFYGVGVYLYETARPL